MIDNVTFDKDGCARVHLIVVGSTSDSEPAQSHSHLDFEALYPVIAQFRSSNADANMMVLKMSNDGTYTCYGLPVLYNHSIPATRKILENLAAKTQLSSYRVKAQSTSSEESTNATAAQASHHVACSVGSHENTNHLVYKFEPQQYRDELQPDFDGVSVTPSTRYIDDDLRKDPIAFNRAPSLSVKNLVVSIDTTPPKQKVTLALAGVTKVEQHEWKHKSRRHNRKK